MKIEITTPSGVVLNNEIKYFVVHGENGEFAILENHIAMISSVKTGYIKTIETDGEDNFYVIESAVIEFSNNKANIMAQYAIGGECLEEAEKKYNTFLEGIKNKNRKSKMDYSKIEKDLQDNIKKSGAGRL